MSDRITLRSATQTDADRLARLWVTTFPDKFGPVLGKQAEAVLRDWLRLSQRHLPTTTVAEVGGEVVGFIVLDTPTAPTADDGRWLWHALQLHNGLFGALRGLLLMVLIDTHHQCNKDEIYIEMLGVAPNWRGQGVARQLLSHAKAVAQVHNISRLTLEVSIDNAPAIKLYQQRGFEIKSTHRSRLFRWVTGHPGYHQMEKEIQPD
jgi:ribosomal protein S18 acetylase RimI-like enzyme